MLNPFTTLVDPRVWIVAGQQVWKAMPWLMPTYGLIYGALTPMIAASAHPRAGVIHTLLAVDYTLAVFSISRLVRRRRW